MYRWGAVHNFPVISFFGILYTKIIDIGQFSQSYWKRETTGWRFSKHCTVAKLAFTWLFLALCSHSHGLVIIWRMSQLSSESSQKGNVSLFRKSNGYGKSKSNSLPTFAYNQSKFGVSDIYISYTVNGQITDVDSKDMTWSLSIIIQNKLCGRPPQYTPAPVTLTFCPWKWCPSHVWRGLPLCQF